MGLREGATDAILIGRFGGTIPPMKQNDRALLQERVRTLVLRHALEATLSRLASVSGLSAEDELLRLEHAIIAAARNLGTVPEPLRLSALVAVEDAVGTIRGAFDSTHQRLEQAPAGAQDEALAA